MTCAITNPLSGCRWSRRLAAGASALGASAGGGRRGSALASAAPERPARLRSLGRRGLSAGAARLRRAACCRAGRPAAAPEPRAAPGLLAAAAASRGGFLFLGLGFRGGLFGRFFLGFFGLLRLEASFLFLLAFLALFLVAFAPLHLFGDPLLLLHAPGRGALLDRAADRADDQLAGADRVVVPRDHVVDRGRVAVGVDQADDRDPQAGRLVDRDLLGFQVGDEDRVGQPVHVADAAEVELELREFGLHLHPLLGRQEVEFALLFPTVELVEAGDPARHRLEVGQQAAQPTFVDVGHLAAFGPFLDHVARLLLGADEEDRAAAGGELTGEAAGVLQQRLGLEEVDDVDPVELAEDEAAHVRVPAARLMAEVDSGLEQFLQACLRHVLLLGFGCVCARPARRDPGSALAAGQDPVRSGRG